MAEPTFQFDRPETDRFAAYIGSLCGLGSPALLDRDAMPDSAKLHFAGRLAPEVRNADGLQALLSQLLEVPVQVDEFVGHWMSLPIDCRCQLGKSPSTGTLGVSALIGDRVWDCQYKFRIAIGPLDRTDYEEFLPDGHRLPRLVAIVRNYIGDELAWDLNLVMKQQAVSTVELGKSGRLGWTSWLCTHKLESNAADLTLSPAETAV